MLSALFDSLFKTSKFLRLSLLNVFLMGVLVNLSIEELRPDDAVLTGNLSAILQSLNTV